MSYDISDGKPTPVTSIETWLSQYKEQNLNMSHDQGMMALASPDDSLLVVGPPRLADGDDGGNFHVVGLINSFMYSEVSQIQPFKPIGSRRFIFSKTNGPVQGSITRMMVLGSNLYRALYAVTDLAPIGGAVSKNKFVQGNLGADSSWFTNLEEDLFRIPIGLGIIYMAPANGIRQGTYKAIGAEYIEACVLQSRQASTQSGQTTIFEQVQFMADRIVPWNAYSGPAFTSTNPVGDVLG